jgi:hypothetical protein
MATRPDRGKKFDRPTPMDDITLAFPASVSHLMPAYHTIPEDFREDRGEARPWLRFQSDWFVKGRPDLGPLSPRSGIDLTMALRHLTAIQRSFEPKHEHKMAAVAWLASRWFERPS